MKVFSNFISSSRPFAAENHDGLVGPSEMPKFVDLLLYDAIMAKAHISLDMIVANGQWEGHQRQRALLREGGLAAAEDKVDKVAAAANTLAAPETVTAMRELGQVVSRLIKSLMAIAKSHVVGEMSVSCRSSTDSVEIDLPGKSALFRLLGVSGSNMPTANKVVFALSGCFPTSLQESMQEWNEAAIVDFPPSSSWRNPSSGALASSSSTSASSPPIELLPYEVYINMMIRTHTASLTGPLKRNMKSLKHCLYSTIRLAEDIYAACGDAELPDMQSHLAEALYPVLVDACTENWSDHATLTFASSSTTSSDARLAVWTYRHFLHSTFDVLLDSGRLVRSGCFGEKLARQIVHVMDAMLDEAEGRDAMDSFFLDSDRQLVRILLTSASPELSPEYASKVLTMFNHLFENAEKNPKEASTTKLCVSISGLSMIPSSQLEMWLSHLVQGNAEEGKSLDPSQMAAVYDNRALLQSLSKYIVREETSIPEEVALSILKCLLPMGAKALNPMPTASASTDGLGFGDLIVVMKTLAGAGSGIGHVQLFRECTGWLAVCNKYIAQKNVVEKLEEGVTSGNHAAMVENACQLLNYMFEVISAVNVAVESDRGAGSSAGNNRPTSPLDGEGNGENEASDYWMDDPQDDDDSAAEDSDDDSLCNKLCTYTQTQKEFMNQHWYHCHTCKMVDGIGVCSVCARVCHADHDITYSKYGSFFCDCGAKEDGSCQAMVKRMPQLIPASSQDAGAGQSQSHRKSSSGYTYEPSLLTSSLRRRTDSPVPGATDNGNAAERTEENAAEADKKALAMKLSAFKGAFVDKFHSDPTIADLMNTLASLLPAVEAKGEKYSPVGRLAKIQEALDRLHSEAKTISQTDQLMMPTLGSQEGAFENVRMNYSGDQGQTIRQLINAHMVRRVVMCCLSAGPSGKRQHLAVAHEKGKITVLQLSALLRQADSSQKKLTLTRKGIIQIHNFKSLEIE